MKPSLRGSRTHSVTLCPLTLLVFGGLSCQVWVKMEADLNDWSTGTQFQAQELSWANLCLLWTWVQQFRYSDKLSLLMRYVNCDWCHMICPQPISVTVANHSFLDSIMPTSVPACVIQPPLREQLSWESLSLRLRWTSYSKWMWRRFGLLDVILVHFIKIGFSSYAKIDGGQTLVEDQH